MAGKPGVFEGWLTPFPAPERLGEGYDGKTNAFGIGEGKLVLSAVLESVLVVRDAIEAPTAKPASRRVAHRRRSTAQHHRFRDHQDRQFRFT